MKLAIETTLEKPIDVVWRSFDDPEHLRTWMPALSEFQSLGGTPRQPGATSRLTFVENGRTFVVDETIVSRREPFEFAGRYDTEHGVVQITNRFESMAGGRTLWRFDAEFAFRGFLRFLGPALRGAIRNRINEGCTRFKDTLESGALAT